MKDRVLFAGTGSGTGKTTITCGILSELIKSGFNVTSFKCGPDYIDPMFHRKVIGTKSYNLDSFFLEKMQLQEYFRTKAECSDISVLEGVMGYYDGAGFTTRGSTYEIADITDTPVVLIVNGKGMGNSIGAVLKGFTSYVTDSHIKGVIVNQVTRQTYEKMKEQILAYGLVPCGFLGKLKEDLILKNRHLGLVTTDEIEDLQNKLDLLSQKVCETVEVERILEIAKSAEDFSDNQDILKKVTAGGNSSGNSSDSSSGNLSCRNERNGIRIAVAKDEAFSFFYEENMELLQKMGCEIVYFSPLHDKKVPSGIGGMILPGGYPEVYAKELAQNHEMKEAVKQAAMLHMPILAECGGYMYLKQSLEGMDGLIHEMTGILPGECKKAEHLVRFGYVTLKAESDNIFCEKGDILRGHEFHYWDSEENGSAFLAEPASGRAQYSCIYADGNILAGFPHIYFPSNQKAVGRFINICKEYQQEYDGKRTDVK